MATFQAIPRPSSILEIIHIFKIVDAIEPGRIPAGSSQACPVRARGRQDLPITSNAAEHEVVTGAVNRKVTILALYLRQRWGSGGRQAPGRTWHQKEQAVADMTRLSGAGSSQRVAEPQSVLGSLRVKVRKLSAFFYWLGLDSVFVITGFALDRLAEIEARHQASMRQSRNAPDRQHRARSQFLFAHRRQPAAMRPDKVARASDRLRRNGSILAKRSHHTDGRNDGRTPSDGQGR